MTTAHDGLAALERAHGPRRTLASDRQHATPLPELLDLATESSDEPRFVLALADLLAALVRAQHEHFPENLFADLDHLAVAVAREARGSDHGVEHLEDASQRLVALHVHFGGDGPIRFRYVHDFLYGFDWARWVPRDPTARGSVGPFDLAFLDYMQRRGDELLELIDLDDGKYPRLRAAAHRNPFGFLRDPASEERLFRELARSGGLPVEAWRADARPRWDRDFAGERERLATELGLALTASAEAR